MTASLTAREVFGFTFKAWWFLFLGVFLPLNFLYHCQALLASLSLIQLGVNVAVLILFCTGIAFGLASLSFLVALTGARFKPDLTNVMRKISLISIVSGIIFIFLGYLWEWLKLVFEIQIPVVIKKGNLHLIIIPLFILSLIIYLFKHFNNQIENKFNSLIASFFKIFTLLFLSSLLFFVSVIITSLNKSPEANQVSLIRSDNQASATKPNIIIVTFDSLASRYTSLDAPDLQTTPSLARLGQASYVFDNMFSTSNWTIPSLASLLTGKYPYHHGMSQKWSYFWSTARQENLPFLLKQLGYETAAIWSNPYSCPWRYNLQGFDRVIPASAYRQFLFQVGLGPATWLEHMIFPESDLYKRLDALLRPDQIEAYTAAYALSQAAALIPSLKPPFFLWIHLFPPHAPYLASNEFLYSRLPDKIFDTKQSFERPLYYPPQDQPAVDQMLKRYQEHLQAVDQEFGSFLDFLQRNEVLDTSLLIVSSDHGEMFERGFWSHGGPYLYEPLIDVPLLMHLPGQTQGRRLGRIASTVDLAPTILDLLGVQPPAWMDGQSLKNAFHAKNDAGGIKLTMNLSFVNDTINFKTRSIGAISGNYELIRYLDMHRDEYYDLKKNQSLKKLNPAEEKIFSVLGQYLDGIPSH
jgi:arylsulfatase A-like enzyme